MSVCVCMMSVSITSGFDFICSSISLLHLKLYRCCFFGGGAWVLVFGASPCPLIISAVILVTTVTDWLKFK